METLKEGIGVLPPKGMVGRKGGFGRVLFKPPSRKGQKGGVPTLAPSLFGKKMDLFLDPLKRPFFDPFLNPPKKTPF